MKRVRIGDGALRMHTGDSLENVITGMGMIGDKTYGTQWMARELDRNQLNMAYRGDWIAKKIIKIPAHDATREWRSWQADAKDITVLEELERVFKVKQKVRLAEQKGRLYGGGALILGVDDGLNPDQPLVYDNLKKDCLKFIHVVSRYDLTVTELERDLFSPYYGKPKYYTSTTGAAGGILNIHPSRVITFCGDEHPDPMNNPYPGWGDPVLQSIADAVKACGTVSQSIASLVSELQVDIVKLPGMMNQMKTAGYEQRLLKRFGLAATAKSIYKILLLDKEEEWQRITASFAQVPELIQVYLLIASGAADIPATRMVGQSPAGLSATGESDIRNYYDRISSDQKNVLQPSLEPLDEVLMWSAFGTRPEEIFYNWNPLWQMTATEKAANAKSKADTFAIDVSSGVIEASIMREARINQLIEDGTYPGLELIIEELDLHGEFLEGAEDLPEPGEEDNDNDPDKAVEGEGGDDGDGDLKTGTKDGKRKKEKRVRYKPRDMRGGTSRAGRFAPTTVRAMPAEVRRFMFGDSLTPRSLYVHRPVLNANEIRKHFKAQGFGTMVPAKEMHVTIMRTEEQVDWSKVGESYPGGGDDGRITIRPGGMRALEQFGQGAYVLCFTSTDLAWRHEDIKRATQADWEWGEYSPHITLSYEAEGLTPKSFIPYRGKIVLGPEIWEEASDGWSEKIIEDALSERR